jgi:hypothetical protein
MASTRVAALQAGAAVASTSHTLWCGWGFAASTRCPGWLAMGICCNACALLMIVKNVVSHAIVSASCLLQWIDGIRNPRVGAACHAGVILMALCSDLHQLDAIGGGSCLHRSQWGGHQECTILLGPVLACWPALVVTCSLASVSQHGVVSHL